MKTRLEKKWKRDSATKVDRLLAAAVEPAACPECGWFQSDMVELLRRQKTDWLLQLAFVGAVSSLVVALICFLGSTPTMASNGFRIGLIFAAVTVLIPIAAIGVRRWILSTYNPNQFYPARPKAIANAPMAVLRDEVTAVVAESSGQVNDPGLTYERQNPDVLPGGWIGVQLLTLAYPDLCVRCMARTDRKKSVPTRYGDFSVPSCKECDGNRSTGRRLLAVMVGALLGLVVVPFALRTGDPYALPGIILLGLILSVIGMVLAYLITAGIGRPMRLRRYSAFRNTIQVWFANESYRTPFIAANRAAVVRMAGLLAQDAR